MSRPGTDLESLAPDPYVLTELEGFLLYFTGSGGAHNGEPNPEHPWVQGSFLEITVLR